jgi:hypothetical protein
VNLAVLALRFTAMSRVRASCLVIRLVPTGVGRVNFNKSNYHQKDFTNKVKSVKKREETKPITALVILCLLVQFFYCRFPQ